ncbi:MAG: cell division protein ZapA [Elusimicrobia bacterium]|nr:cell division protein ZapA [Elusimicrobiota bacterium]
MKCRVTILGTPYNLEIEDGEEEKVKRIAEFIDSEMKKISRDGKIVDTYRVAINALLEITSRYFDLKEKASIKTGGVKNQIEMLNRRLEEVLEEKISVGKG